MMGKLKKLPLTGPAFSFFRYTFDKGSADSSNANRLFQCSVGGFSEDALPAGSQPKLIATYYFHITNWSSGESFCVDWAGFVSASFVDPTAITSLDQYAPTLSDPFVSPDGCAIYFAATLGGGVGAADLYVVEATP